MLAAGTVLHTDLSSELTLFKFVVFPQLGQGFSLTTPMCDGDDSNLVRDLYFSPQRQMQLSSGSFILASPVENEISGRDSHLHAWFLLWSNFYSRDGTHRAPRYSRL